MLGDVFFVLTDTDHKSGEQVFEENMFIDYAEGFKLQAILLARLISLVETDSVQAPLFDPATVSDSSMSNVTYLKQYIADLLSNAFGHVQSWVCSFILYH